MEPMQWLSAPDENLRTWRLVMRIITGSVISIVAVLLLMAVFLT